MAADSRRPLISGLRFVPKPAAKRIQSTRNNDTLDPTPLPLGLGLPWLLMLHRAPANPLCPGFIPVAKLKQSIRPNSSKAPPYVGVQVEEDHSRIHWRIYQLVNSRSQNQRPLNGQQDADENQYEAYFRQRQYITVNVYGKVFFGKFRKACLLAKDRPLDLIGGSASKRRRLLGWLGERAIAEMGQKGVPPLKSAVVAVLTPLMQASSEKMSPSSRFLPNDSLVKFSDPTKSFAAGVP